MSKSLGSIPELQEWGVKENIQPQAHLGMMANTCKSLAPTFRVLESRIGGQGQAELYSKLKAKVALETLSQKRNRKNNKIY